MDKARICRELAEKLETISQDVIAFPMIAVSPRGFWRGYGVVTGWKWGAVNFFTDEAACARLLEAMPAPLLAMNKPGDLMGVYIAKWLCQASGSPIIEAFDDDRRTAIVLAACKWLGISTE